MKKWNVYDFDHTIYNGDASFDFIKYCLIHDAKLWVYLPSMIWTLSMYIIGLRTRKEVKQAAFGFLRSIEDVDKKVSAFWRLYEKKIKTVYSQTKTSANIIVSASPEFLLEPVAIALDARLLATKMNKKSGRITGKNCRGEEKVRRLKEAYPGISIHSAYSDSVSDVPILTLAQKGYIVNDSRITPIEVYRPTLSKRLRSVAFIRFLLVGCLNALIGILIAYGFSFFISSPQIAFAIGFAIGLVPSYFLNSVFTFRDKIFTLKKYGKFVISYIPNFLVMFLFVHLFTESLGLYPLLTYTLAVAIAVPVTFTLLSIFTFRTGGKL